MQEKRNINRDIRGLVYAGVLIAMGVLLPQAFHIVGSSLGRVFSPIQLPAFLAGAILGPIYGGIVGAIVPILSHIITGMPPVPTVWYMIFELATYGIAMGILRKKCNIYVALFISIFIGRVVYAGVAAIGISFFGLEGTIATFASFFGSIVRGLPGIAVQFVLIPILYHQLNKSKLLL